MANFWAREYSVKTSFEFVQEIRKEISGYHYYHFLLDFYLWCDVSLPRVFENVTNVTRLLVKEEPFFQFGDKLTDTDIRGGYHRPVHETFDLVNEKSRAQEAIGRLENDGVRTQLLRPK